MKRSNIKKYFELVKFSHTVFALPFALGSMFVAANGSVSFKTLTLIILSMVAARNAAMGFNRLVDAKIDALNPRTENRHIPAGTISSFQAALFIILNGLLFVFSAFLLNTLAFYSSVPVLFFLLSYSYWKRFSWLCHIFLGLAIGMSPLGAWIGVRGEISLFPFILGLILTFWIAGFDIIYATQDYQIDKKLGLHSAVVRFGVTRALYLAKFLHTIMYGLIWALYFHFELDIYWIISSVSIGIILLYLHIFLKNRSLDELNSGFFRANSIISILIFGSLLCFVYITQGNIQ